MPDMNLLPPTPELAWFGVAGLEVPADAFGAPPNEILPLSADSGRTAPEWLRVVDALVNEELARAGKDWVRVPAEALWELDPVEQELLALPPEARGLRFRIATRGIPGRPTFQTLLEVHVGDERIPQRVDRKGGFIDHDGALLRLPRHLLPVLEELDRERPRGALSSDLRHVGRLKARALLAHIEVDGFLEREDIQAPEGLGLTADFLSPDEVHLSPRLIGVDEPPPGLDEGPTQSVYSAVVGGRRPRVVLDNDQVAAIDALKRRRVLKGADVARFQANPEAYIPEQFDLSRFSPRVKGVIPYRYRSEPYLSVTRGQNRDWFSVQAGASLILDEDLFNSGPDQDGTAFPSPMEEGQSSPWSGSAADGKPDSQDTEKAGGRESGATFGHEEWASLCRQVVATGEEYVLHDGGWIQIPIEEARDFLAFLEALERDEEGKLGVPAGRWDYVLDVATNLTVLEFSVEDDLPGLLPSRPVEVPPYPVPELLRAELRPYQLEGFRWLRQLHERGQGGLLADDMGLGKTVQVIALLAYLKEIGGLAPSLIVVPKTLMVNWQEELRRFCPDIRRIYAHEGTGRIRSAAALSAFEVVLVTYSTLRIDQQFLATVDWRAVVCDEAQNIKNPTARVTSAVKAMKAEVRVALTGTPVENGLSELWCIADFVQPGRLGSGREFRNLMERPIVEGVSSGGSRAEALALLHDRLGPHYLRRTKEEMLHDLPAKTENRPSVDLGPRQIRLYAEARRSVAQRETIPIVGLQKLIQICSHPELMEPSHAPPDQLVIECPKLAETLRLLDEIHRVGEKALIFTRFKAMQYLLQAVIRDRFDFYASILNGDLSGGERQSLIRGFQTRPGFGAMILAPEAAGVGLNITAANHVIHYTRLWNPAKERQATDRVHRIGQIRPVQVYYPIVTGSGWRTVEEHLDRLLREKSDLAENVVVPSEGLDVTAELGRLIQEEHGG